MALSDQSYISEEDALNEFKRILAEKPSWQKLTDSQTVEHFSRQVTWPLRQALHRLERVQQESHLTTAIDRSSILAGAEDRQYVPRKPSPSRGKAVFTNKGGVDVLVESGTTWVSDDQLTYEVLEAVSVPAGSYAATDIAQLETVLIEHTVTETKPYYEINLEKKQSSQVSDVTIEIDEGMGSLPWTLKPRLLNTDRYSRAYDEFYTALDELSFRFGNSDHGRIPQANARVTISLKLTEGESELLPGQKLGLVGDSADPNIGMISALTQTSVVGGRARETIEEIRRNALYYVLYDHQLVWDDDYLFHIKRRWPEAIWVNVWGEQEQEQVYGFNTDWINNIFISAYSPDNPNILTDIKAGMEAPMNRRYTIVLPNLKPYHVVIKGTIPRSVVRSTAEITVRNLLSVAYGLNSPTKLEAVRLHDMYDILNSTGHFKADGAQLNIQIIGNTSSNGLEDLVYLDVDNSTIDINYG